MNLNRRICPGCGKENPGSNVAEWFKCDLCDWESDDPLPSIRKMINDADWKHCNDVNLSAFLATLLKNELK